MLEVPEKSLVQPIHGKGGVSKSETVFKSFNKHKFGEVVQTLRWRVL